ncbi:glycosyltransferase involved in cell wall biosynthesis [Bacillus sp. SORGH_AS 510]|uniref:glycosyltransferase family 4 protein n=1 Tax=Bacillus sp. SORGH_AS_0510 TaxID=3041771 RepID=UPI00278AC33A|nr:glycosyltransferase family 4 protein [Bacillus sp. SORGH_AS_0510]MDQ1147988.1 glycosyltransferase involved in cell wall biosynthesis [Bacillus sp. SORGH_AS_0510]
MIQELRSKELNKRLSRISLAKNQLLTELEKRNENLHIVYAMTHVGICGGVKVIFEHANKLQKAGAKVTLVSHFQKPSWFPIEAEYLQVPFDLELAKGIPNCDLIVATYWDHIQACIETGIAPVVYFEQGDFHLFDYESMNRTLKNFIHKQFQIPPFIYTVSNQAASLISKIYGREAQVFPNAVDDTIFSTNGDKEIGERPYMLMVGGESAAFKGIPTIIEAYKKVKEELDIDLYWITPGNPSEDKKNQVTKVFVNPSQQKIGSLYRGAALYICGSTYENFPLPPLEAMACGCPVVTTNNPGSLEYAVHEQNALICNMKDPVDMAEKIRKVFVNPEIKEKLINNGLSTANQFKWENIIQNILEYYTSIAANQVKSESSIDDWEIGINEEDLVNKKDYDKLKKFLLVTNADIVKAPVLYHFNKIPQLARWETIAIRKDGEDGIVEHCFCPILLQNQLQLYDLNGYQSFLTKQFDEALEEFTQLYNNETSNLQAVWGKWMVLTLIRLQRKQEAKQRVKQLIKQYPHNADMYKLNILLTEDGKQDLYSTEMIKVLGDATSFPEFFYPIQP